jgi:hypothetical protein
MRRFCHPEFFGGGKKRPLRRQILTLSGTCGRVSGQGWIAAWGEWRPNPEVDFSAHARSEKGAMQVRLR